MARDTSNLRAIRNFTAVISDTSTTFCACSWLPNFARNSSTTFTDGHTHKTYTKVNTPSAYYVATFRPHPQENNQLAQFQLAQQNTGRIMVPCIIYKYQEINGKQYLLQ